MTNRQSMSIYRIYSRTNPSVLVARIDVLEKGMQLLIDSLDQWEKDVEKIIGRFPRHYIELDQARELLSFKED